MARKKPPTEPDVPDAADDDRAEAPEDLEQGSDFEDGGGAEASGADGTDDGIPETDSDDSLGRMLSGNFIEYASYVIKDRAIPDVDDGLKPVQRRILHSLHVLDDGRFHKVANVIGHTMQYHPHGDASIGSALVVLANKEYFVDRQGNFGNIYTGDDASAARYIECRLSNLAREVLFNPEITEFVDSYDGRRREPVCLPAKVPALLMLGADGIAVGMTTHVLPHNFCELLKAQISVLRGESFTLYPDFLQGGIMDVGEYDDGRGRVKLRAKIDAVSEKTLVIREIPATTTTEALITSIEDAVRKGKIKLASISDYTGETVEIEISLPRGIYSDETIKQLYAYTSCEVSINSNITVIKDNMPVMMTVTEVIRHNTERLVEYLRRELEIELGKLQDRLHDRTLAQIFIENRIYKRIEEVETYEGVLAEVRAGFEPFADRLVREITDEDIEKLLQLQIRRISMFDINRNKEEIDKILKGIEETKGHLANLTVFAIDYLNGLLERYGPGFPRRTRIADLEEVDVREVALMNVKVGHDRTNHFVGSEIKNSNKNESPLVCTEYDKLVLIQNDGAFRVIPIPEKLYVGPVKYVFKLDREQIFSMIYRDRKKKVTYAKRFRVDRFIMDKEYKGLPPNCLVESIYTNYGVVVRAELEPNKRRSVSFVDVTFEDLPIRSATARGLKVTAYPVVSLTQVKRGTTSSPDGGEEAPPEGDEAPPEADSENPEAGETAGPVAADEPDRSDATQDLPEDAAASEPVPAPDEDGGPDGEAQPEGGADDVEEPPAKTRAPARTRKARKSPPAKPEPPAQEEPPEPEPTAAPEMAPPDTVAAELPESPARRRADEWKRRTEEGTAVPRKPSPAAEAEAEGATDDAMTEADGPGDGHAPVPEPEEAPKRRSRRRSPKAKSAGAAADGNASSASVSEGGERESATGEPAPDDTVSAEPGRADPDTADDRRAPPDEAGGEPIGPDGVRKRKRIDEETPFFLE